MFANRNKSFARSTKDRSLQLSSSLLRDLDTPLSRRLLSSIECGSYLDLVSTKINPSDYSSSSSFKSDYLAAEFLSKFPHFDLCIDRRAVAIDKFLQSELSCHSVNVKLGTSYGWATLSPSTRSILSMAREKIRRAVGPFNWNDAEIGFNFGPGASLSRSRLESDAFFKYGLKPSVTKSCSVLALIAVRRIPLWFNHLCEGVGLTSRCLSILSDETISGVLFDIVPGNRVTTVPKNAKTDRIIAIEPDLNMFIQMGISSVLRSRLRAVGVDLSSQVLNQSLAREGSRFGLLSTIDLSSASDSISRELVRFLLPPDWYRAFCLARSPLGTLPSGGIVNYQKVSSMGNGFTFDLETLIFWGIGISVKSFLSDVGSPFAVYGDDIVISVTSSDLLIKVLSDVGFSTNTSKTFLNGPFRESCGKHYFNGTDVTPFYIKDRIDSDRRLIWFSNSIRIWSFNPFWSICRPLIKPTYDLSCGFITPHVARCSTTVEHSDIALIRTFDECSPAFSKDLQCYIATGYLPTSRKKIPGGIPYLLRCLSKLERSGGRALTAGGIPVVTVYRRGKIYTSHWCGLGPWLKART